LNILKQGNFYGKQEHFHVHFFFVFGST